MWKQTALQQSVKHTSKKDTMDIIQTLASEAIFYPFADL